MRTVTNYFIVNLSLADILVTITCLPATLVVDITETWFFGQPLCKVIPYLQVLFYCVCVHITHFIKKRKNNSVFLIVMIWWKSIPAAGIDITEYILSIKGLFHLWICLHLHKYLSWSTWLLDLGNTLSGTFFWCSSLFVIFFSNSEGI